MSFHVVRPSYVFCVRFLPSRQFFVAPAETRDSNIFVYCSVMVSFGLHSRLVHPKCTWPRNDGKCNKIHDFQQFLPHRSHILFLPAILMSSAKTDKKSPCLWWTNIHYGIPSHSSSNEACSNSLCHSNPAHGWLCKVRSRGTTGSSFSPWFWPFVSWKTYPNIYRLCLLNFEQFWSIFHFYLCVGRWCISCWSIIIW